MNSSNRIKIKETKQRLSELIYDATSPACSTDKRDWPWYEKVFGYYRLHKLESASSAEVEKFNNMIAALMHLQADLHSNIANEMYIDAVNHIIDAATQLRDHFWQEFYVRFPHQPAEDEMELLKTTIELLSDTLNEKSRNVDKQQSFVSLCETMSRLEQSIDKQKLLPENKKSDFYISIGKSLLISMAVLMPAFFIAATVISGGSILILGAMISFLVLGGTGATCYLKGENLKLANRPSNNLVKTLFAAESTAKSCQIPFVNRNDDRRMLNK